MEILRNYFPLCEACGWSDSNMAAESVQVRCNVRAHKDEFFPVWSCPDCGSIHSGAKVDLDRYYTDYPIHRRKPDIWSREGFRTILRRLKKAGLNRASSILDYGCGNGIFLDFLRSNGYLQSFGYDPYSGRHADKAALGKAYDFVAMLDVIEHVEAPADLMAQCGGLLHPGGVLAMTTANAAALDLSSPEEFNHELHQPYHLHIMTPSALAIMGKAAGLEPIALYTRHYCDRPWPLFSWSFIIAYLRAVDDTIDAAFEPPRWLTLFNSPRVLLTALLGSIFPRRTCLMMVFRRNM